MTLRLLARAFGALAPVTISIFLLSCIAGTGPVRGTGAFGYGTSGVIGVCLGAATYQLAKWMLPRWWRVADRGKESIYGLQHGRLHLQVPTPMWMNMGYWPKDSKTQMAMAEACRDLLKAVLAEAGFSSEIEKAGIKNGTRRTKCLIDLGFGCGDQTIYLMSDTPVRPCDRDWWDGRDRCVRFDHYVGITKDLVQARYASGRVEELIVSSEVVGQTKQVRGRPDISLFCADAATPASWNEQVRVCMDRATEETEECWVLALDTAYHFSPSRWPLVKYACMSLDASFMAFDLCLSPTATFAQMLALRLLTMLMGAPWANFVTPDVYRQKLVESGYPEESISITDTSEHVFTPLARYLDEQDTRLQTLGLGIGSFNIAKSLFAWWGRTGVVRGVVVVAKHIARDR